MSSFIGIGVEVVFVQKIAIFEIQITRYWVYHPNDPNMGPSKFPSSCPISMPLSPSNPRCWGSMHIYIGYFHPKYNFHISHINSNYKISSWTVYFYRARYRLRDVVILKHTDVVGSHLRKTYLFIELIPRCKEKTFHKFRQYSHDIQWGESTYNFSKIYQVFPWRSSILALI